MDDFASAYPTTTQADESLPLGLIKVAEHLASQGTELRYLSLRPAEADATGGAEDIRNEGRDSQPHGDRFGEEGEMEIESRGGGGEEEWVPLFGQKGEQCCCCCGCRGCGTSMLERYSLHMLTETTGAA
ncbi:hypothetical protein AAFF_G00024800 [Aldrovandia affinis]|uniref:Uncharacterized protein n=1 Tax=Aldrovandia affinis TaxID=143900 RepID=A0AAD7WZH8_9TELE|nr:hypothetical protein AAFF_G00024800 [Aldrovandia affinis]